MKGMENRWGSFTDDEIVMLWDCVGNGPGGDPVGDLLFDELTAEFKRRRPDDERLLIVLARLATEPPRAAGLKPMMSTEETAAVQAEVERLRAHPGTSTFQDESKGNRVD